MKILEYWKGWGVIKRLQMTGSKQLVSYNNDKLFLKLRDFQFTHKLFTVTGHYRVIAIIYQYILLSLMYIFYV